MMTIMTAQEMNRINKIYLERLQYAQALFAKMIIWTTGVPDRNGKYDIARDAYAKALAFSGEDFSRIEE